MRHLLTFLLLASLTITSSSVLAMKRKFESIDETEEEKNKKKREQILVPYYKDRENNKIFISKDVMQLIISFLLGNKENMNIETIGLKTTNALICTNTKIQNIVLDMEEWNDNDFINNLLDPALEGKNLSLYFLIINNPERLKKLTPDRLNKAFSTACKYGKDEIVHLYINNPALLDDETINGRFYTYEDGTTQGKEKISWMRCSAFYLAFCRKRDKVIRLFLKTPELSRRLKIKTMNAIIEDHYF